MNTQLGIEEVIKKYKLPKSEVYQHKDNWKIITANGIRKIISEDKINISKHLHHYNYADKTAVVSCAAYPGVTSELESQPFEAFGEVSPDNNTFSGYFVSVAEKRAEGRAVLMLVGLYQLGFRSEFELDEQVAGQKILDKRKEQTQVALSDTLSKIGSPDKKKSKSLIAKAGVDFRVDENSKVVESAKQVPPFENMA